MVGWGRTRTSLFVFNYTRIHAPFSRTSMYAVFCCFAFFAYVALLCSHYTRSYTSITIWLRRPDLGLAAHKNLRPRPQRRFPNPNRTTDHRQSTWLEIEFLFIHIIRCRCRCGRQLATPVGEANVRSGAANGEMRMGGSCAHTHTRQRTHNTC